MIDDRGWGRSKTRAPGRVITHIIYVYVHLHILTWCTYSERIIIRTCVQAEYQKYTQIAVHNIIVITIYVYLLL